MYKCLGGRMQYKVVKYLFLGLLLTVGLFVDFSLTARALSSADDIFICIMLLVNAMLFCVGGAIIAGFFEKRTI
jgi:hypothetical protein